MPFLIEIIKSRLKMKALPPQLQKQLEAKMGEYPNPLVAIETADQLNALGNFFFIYGEIFPFLALQVTFI